MFKLIGAIMIMAGTAAWGVRGVMRLRARARALASLLGAVGMMRSEICDRLTPTAEMFELLTEAASYPAGLLFRNAARSMSQLGARPFPVIWDQAVAMTPELLLTPPEVQVLTELGLFLGRYNVDEQRAALGRAERRLEELARRAEAQREANSRMHAFLGVAAGIFAIVILI